MMCVVSALHSDEYWKHDDAVKGISNSHIMHYLKTTTSNGQECNGNNSLAHMGHSYTNWFKRCAYLSEVLNDQSNTGDNAILLPRHLDYSLRWVWTTLNIHFDMCTTVLQHTINTCCCCWKEHHTATCVYNFSNNWYKTSSLSIEKATLCFVGP